MSGDDKQLELEALAAVGEMLLFDQARGNPEEAARILRCARLFARSEDAAQRLSELCNEAGSDATWRENIVEELQDREDLQAAEAAMEARRQAQLVAQAVAAAAQEVAHNTSAKQMWQWAAGCIAVAFLCVGLFGWYMHSSGKDSGYQAGYGAGYTEAKDEKAAAAWANTPEGRLAYRFAQTGSLASLAKCDRPGWYVEKGVCYVKPASDGTYGWRLP